MMLANSGFRAWVWQRFSAVYLGLYILAVLLLFTFSPPQSYTAWLTLLKQPFFLSCSVLFFAALGVHAWVGIRDIILDYIKLPFIRLLVLTLFAALLLLLLARAFTILLTL